MAHCSTPNLCTLRACYTRGKLMTTTATIADLTGDAVLYRDLEPCDLRLPRLAELRSSLGIAAGPVPRKRDQAYARLILALARADRHIRAAPPLTALAVIGDTENDQLLASHLDALGELPAYGFIGEDRPVATELLHWHGAIATATRWHLIEAWAATLEERGVDYPGLTILIDIDKTLLGPRGRSDGAIDDARAEGALKVAHTYYPELNVPAFRRIYAELCRKEWHPYTLDNQDYVVATALLSVVGTLQLDELRTRFDQGTPPSFAETLAAAITTTPPELVPLYREIATRVADGDPTPFKAFRRAELIATLDRMVDGRLTLCDEVFTLCQQLRARGAICMAASDKPAESAIPSAEQEAAGLRALHHTPAPIG